MLTLSILFVMLLILWVALFPLYYYKIRIDATYEDITIGIGPKLYVKRYQDIKFVFKAFPFYVGFDILDFNYGKLKSMNDWFIRFNFLLIVIPQSILILLSNGREFWWIFYKILLTGTCSEAEIITFNYNLGRLFVQPTLFFFVATLSTAVVYVWYIIALRGVANFLLDKLANLLKITINSTSSYLIGTAIILYFWFNGLVDRLLLILYYKSIVFGLIDWALAYVILILLASFVIEILSRKQQKQVDS